MSSEKPAAFSKDNLDLYLKELSKEYRKLAGKNMPAEVILIGGAAIVENYVFRNMTTDVDAIINSSSIMKEAINRVGDKYDLPNGWLNSDLVKTGSYSEKLVQYSELYRNFSHVLDVRTINGEYLVAMKLHSFRQYKNDVSDIIGIMAEHEKRGDAFTFSRIEKAVIDLYGSWKGFPDGAREFMLKTVSNGNYSKTYELAQENEKAAREQLIDFNDNYPGSVTDKNVNDILGILEKRKEDSNHK